MKNSILILKKDTHLPTYNSLVNLIIFDNSFKPILKSNSLFHPCYAAHSPLVKLIFTYNFLFVIIMNRISFLLQDTK